MRSTIIALGLSAALGTSGAAAQAAPARPDSQAVAAAAAPQAPARPAAYTPPRAAWLSDRLPLRIGDILTVVIDEQANANERVSTTATANRAQRAQLGIGVDSATRLGPSKDFSTSHNSSSNDVGESGRQGNLSAVLTLRVTAIDPSGMATIEGSKSVSIDGRLQEVKMKGLVRPEDVNASNLVSSSRVADAVITYKGKKIGPRSGILGKILSILWP